MLILKIKNIILIYFQIKNILKNNYNHNNKQTLIFYCIFYYLNCLCYIVGFLSYSMNIIYRI